MAKATTYSKQKRPSQTLKEDSIQAMETRKRMKTGDGDEDPPRRSSRTNMGKGGQITQMESIERAQTQTCSRVSKLTAVTADEPLNPMAPLAIDARPHASRNYPGDTVLAHPSARPPPLPTYKASLEDSRYGCAFPLEGKSSTSSSGAPLAPHVHARPVSRGLAPARHGPIASTPRSSSGGRVFIASARSGSVTPSSRGGSPALSSRGGSLALSSRGGSLALSSRGGSPALSSRVGSPALSSRVGSPALSSRGGSVDPSFWTGPTATTLRNESSMRACSGVSHVPSRLSQVQQGTRLPFTRTYSAHSMEDLARQSRHSLDTPEPPPYNNDNDSDNEAEGGKEPSEPNSMSQQVDELFIDEVSPDEDERIGELALRGLPNTRRIPDDRDIDPALLSGGYSHNDPVDQGRPDSEVRDTGSTQFEQDRSDEGAVCDVVDEHHQRNRVPRPPDLSTLRDIRLQQQNTSARGQRRVRTDNGLSTTSVPSQVPPVLPQVPSADVPPGPLDGPATKFRAYPISFRPVIERAKLVAQCNCASVNPFLARSEFLDFRSVEYFNEALAETANVPQGYWPQYRKELSILLWEAMMSWRSTLKSKARELVPRFYPLGAELPPAENKAEAQALIRRSAFTFDGVDEEGSTNNMAAPALGALIISFFYNGPSSLAIIFPDVFAGEVPQVTVCLAATALRAAIDEYTATGVREDRKFEYQGYSKIYSQFRAMQNSIDEDPKHASKTEALRIAWAGSADTPANEPSSIIAFEEDFQPILD